MKLNELIDEVKLLAADCLKAVDILILILDHPSEEFRVFRETLTRYFVLNPVIGLDIVYFFHHHIIINF